MSTLFIHPGMHKTGTSSIQQSLASLPPDRGPALITLGTTKGNLSSRALRAFAEPEEVLRRKGGRQTVDDVKTAGKLIRQKMKKELEANAGRDVVLSGEGLSILSEDQFARIIKIAPHEAVRVIVYVREPVGSMGSKLQQRIKAGGALAWRPQSLIPNYRQNNEKYERLARRLPQLSYEFVPFSRDALFKGCVVRDFCRRVGITINDDEVLTRNESLTRDATRLLYCRNLWLEETKAVRKSAKHSAADLNEVGGPKLRLSAAVVREAIEKTRDSIDWMAARMGEGWYRPEIEADDGTEVGSAADLSAVPEAARAWLQGKVAQYDGSPDPLAIGAAMDVFVMGRREEVTEARRSVRKAAKAAPAPLPAAAAPAVAGGAGGKLPREERLKAREERRLEAQRQRAARQDAGSHPRARSKKLRGAAGAAAAPE